MDATELVAAFVTTIDRQDADALGELFAEDALFINILGMPMVGRQGIVDGHRWALSGPLRHSTVELVETTVVGDGIVHALLRRGRRAGAPDEGLPPGDTRLLVTARGGLVVAAANVAVSPPPGA